LLLAGGTPVIVWLLPWEHGWTWLNYTMICIYMITIAAAGRDKDGKDDCGCDD